jgi:hypothetical protein
VLLAILMRAFSGVWSGIGAVREDTEAMLVARAVIEASTPRHNLVPLTQEGMSGRYAWSIAIANTGIATAVPQQGPSGQQSRNQPSLFNPPTQLAANRQPSPDDAGANAERGQPWSLFKIAVAVRAPSGRRTTLETYRLSRPAPR